MLLRSLRHGLFWQFLAEKYRVIFTDKTQFFLEMSPDFAAKKFPYNSWKTKTCRWFTQRFSADCQPGDPQRDKPEIYGAPFFCQRKNVFAHHFPNKLRCKWISFPKDGRFSMKFVLQKKCVFQFNFNEIRQVQPVYPRRGRNNRTPSHFWFDTHSCDNFDITCAYAKFVTFIMTFLPNKGQI